MNIKICDCIMGTGKSQSAIRFINENIDKKYVYITPYLTETDRIKNSCPDARFVEPSNKIKKYGFSKLNHTIDLLACGENIATTHSAFKSYTFDMLKMLRDGGYTLIIDESLDVLQKFECHTSDIELLESSGYIKFVEGKYVYTGKEYDGDRFKDMIDMFKCNNLVHVDGIENPSFYYWTFPLEVLGSFKEVYILTYMFKYSELKYFFDIYNVDYEYIGVSIDSGSYKFDKENPYVPEYVSEIASKIHICDNIKLNKIGEREYSVTKSWYQKDNKRSKKVGDAMYNYFHNVNRRSSSKVLWSTYKSEEKKVKPHGYAKRSTPFNLKATNDYRLSDTLVYAVNIYPNPEKVSFFKQYGIKYDSDGYALSTMVQWVWRSAIRDGYDIYIYIMSSRMRMLFKNWIKELENYNGIVNK